MYFLAALVLVCVDMMVMSSAYARTGALGGGMSAVYMLNNVGERMSFCGTSDLN